MDLDPTLPPLTVAQSAEALNVSIDTIYDAVARGEINALRLGRAIRIPRGEIARLLRVSEVVPERLSFELPGSIPRGSNVEFFADRECSEPVVFSITASSTFGASSIVMPRSRMPALYAPPGIRQVWARWTSGAETFVAPCRKLP